MGSLAFPVQCWFRFLNNVRLRRLGVGYSFSDIDLEVVYEEPAVKLATIFGAFQILVESFTP